MRLNTQPKFQALFIDVDSKWNLKSPGKPKTVLNVSLYDGLPDSFRIYDSKNGTTLLEERSSKVESLSRKLGQTGNMAPDELKQLVREVVQDYSGKISQSVKDRLSVVLDKGRFIPAYNVKEKEPVKSLHNYHAQLRDPEQPSLLEIGTRVVSLLIENAFGKK